MINDHDQGDREEPAEAVVRAATERTVSTRCRQNISKYSSKAHLISSLQVSKAAIGLARLCLDPTTADSVVRLGGLDKLFPLAEVNLVFSIPSLQSRISILSSKAG